MAECFEDSDVAFVYQLPLHNTRLLDSLHRQWMDSKHCDLELLVQGEIILVHACVVSAFSPTVAEILLCRSIARDLGAGDHVELKNGSSSLLAQNVKSDKNTVEMRFSFEVVKCVLSAFYTGVLRAKADHLEELLEVAEWLCAADVVAAVKQRAVELASNSSQLSISSKLTREKENRTSLASKGAKNFIERENGRSKRSIQSKNFQCVNEVGADSLFHRKIDDHISCLQEIESPKDAQGISSITSMFGNADQFHKSKTVINPAGTGTTGGKTGFTSERLRHNIYSDPKVMVARLKMELTEVKQNCQRRKMKQTQSEVHQSKAVKSKAKKMKEKNSSVIPTLSSKGERGASKKRKKGAITMDTYKGKLIEKVEDSDPMKQELDFLVGSTNFVKCHKCHQKFDNIEIYYDHIKNHPIFTCKECGIEFMRKWDLTRHMRYFHDGGSHLKCKLCGTEGDENEKTKTPFTAKSETEFRRHALEVHGINKAFICPQNGCSFSTARYTDLVKHQQIHSEEKDFKCDKCGQAFAQHEGLQSHQRSCYHLQQYLCDLCGQGFNQAQGMRLHRRVVHFGEKRHKCQVCSNTFSDHTNLRRHMRIHDNSFPYACQVCGQKYRHSNSLKAHMASKHPGLPSEQYNLSLCHPRNKLGGKSYKPRGPRKSLNKRECLLRSDGQALVFSTSLFGGGGQKLNHEVGVERSTNQESAQYRGECQLEEQLHQPVANQTDESRVPESNTTNIVASSVTELDVAVDQQMVLAAQPEKTVDECELVAISNKGEQCQTENMQEYAALIEKQTPLYAVHPNGEPGSENVNSVVNMATATLPVSTHLLNNNTHAVSSNHLPETLGALCQNGTSVSSPNFLSSNVFNEYLSSNTTNSIGSNELNENIGKYSPKGLMGEKNLSKPGFANYHLQNLHHHQPNEQSVYGGYENSATSKGTFSTPLQSSTTILTFPINTLAYQPRDTLLHVFKAGTEPLLEGGVQSSNHASLQRPGVAQFCYSPYKS